MPNNLSRHHSPFQFQQPLLGLQSLPAAVAVQFAVPADDAVTGDHQRHGVGGVGPPDRARGIRPADLDCDIVIGTCLTIWDAVYHLQGLALEGTEERPVDRDGERAPFAVQVFIQLPCIGRDPPGVVLNGTFESLQEGIKMELSVRPFDGDQTEVRGREAQVSEGSPVQFADVDGFRGGRFCLHKKITTEREARW